MAPFSLMPASDCRDKLTTICKILDRHVSSEDAHVSIERLYSQWKIEFRQALDRPQAVFSVFMA
jgi:hypothetical protein